MRQTRNFWSGDKRDSESKSQSQSEEDMIHPIWRPCQHNEETQTEANTPLPVNRGTSSPWMHNKGTQRVRESESQSEAGMVPPVWRPYINTYITKKPKAKQTRRAVPATRQKPEMARSWEVTWVTGVNAGDLIRRHCQA